MTGHYRIVKKKVRYYNKNKILNCNNYIFSFLYFSFLFSFFFFHQTIKIAAYLNENLTLGYVFLIISSLIDLPIDYKYN